MSENPLLRASLWSPDLDVRDLLDLTAGQLSTLAAFHRAEYEAALTKARIFANTCRILAPWIRPGDRDLLQAVERAEAEAAARVPTGGGTCDLSGATGRARAARLSFSLYRNVFHAENTP